MSYFPVTLVCTYNNLMQVLIAEYCTFNWHNLILLSLNVVCYQESFYWGRHTEKFFRVMGSKSRVLLITV